MEPCKIAIVGAGYMAQEHARAFASLPGVEIVGICGRNPARALALARTYGTPTFDSVTQMFDRTRAHAVVVAVPELAAAEVANTCFQLPWTCLLEKPVGVDLPQAEELLRASRNGRAHCYVALNRRCYGATRQAMKELAADDSPRLIQALDQQDMASARAIGQPEQVVRNFMYANSIHVIDYLSVFGRGSVRDVDNVERWNPDSPGIVVAAVHFDSGDTALYQAVWDGPGPWAVAVTTRQMRLEMRPLEKLSIQRRGERRLTEAAADPVDAEFKPGLRVQAERLVAAVRGEQPALATLEDATRTMRLCARIYGLPGADDIDAG